MPRLLPALLLPTISLWLFAQATPPKPAYDMSLPRAEKITLAKSAAPPEISDKATVYVLDSTGYVKVQDGSNGFSCFVDRQTSLNQEPTCFDAEGSATTLPTRLFAEEQRAKGRTEDQIKADIDAGYKGGRSFWRRGSRGLCTCSRIPSICSWRRIISSYTLRRT